ncbi:MAG: uracil-DNA glycosylase [bacterium]
MNKKKLNALGQIEDEISHCDKCSLCISRTRTVPGEGNIEADIVFIGEAPGAKEDATGQPFCGAAGKFLDKMLISINLDRDKVFITNTLKCRPPENRDPLPSEKLACRDYLIRQIEIINPKIIVCLGRHAMADLLPEQGLIAQLHGQLIKHTDNRLYLPLYHPAAALHNGGLRTTLMSDFQKIPEILQKINQ